MLHQWPGEDVVRCLRRQVQSLMLSELASIQPRLSVFCRQKIQYHQRQKQELEGLRKECTLLLRERFTLDQAIR